MPIGSRRAPKSWMAEPHRGELDEQVVLGDAELEAGRAASCARELGRYDLEAEHVLRFGVAHRPRRLTHAPRLVDTVTSGEVVTIRRRASPSSPAMALRICRSLPACSTCGRWPAAAPRESRTIGAHAPLTSGVEGRGIDEGLQLVVAAAEAREFVPSGSVRDPHAPEVRHLIERHCRNDCPWACERQTLAL